MNEVNNHTATLLPVNESKRLQQLDIIRGVAILGILILNIVNFGLPEKLYNSIYGLTSQGTMNNTTRIISGIVFDGNMRGLFCLLFGTGIILFARQCEKNNSGIFPFYRRMFWLALFGIFDCFILLWEGDILYEYAVCGAILIIFRKLKPLYLLLIASCVLIYLNWYNVTDYYETMDKYDKYTKIETKLTSGEHLSKDEKTIKTEWEDISSQFGPYSEKETINNKKEIAEEIKSNQGDYAACFNENLKYLKYITDPKYYLSFLPEIFTMLLGMSLFKLNWITIENRKRNARLAAFGLLFGIGMSSYITFTQPYTLIELNKHMESIHVPRVIFYTLFNACTTIGILGLLLLFCSSNSFSKVKSALEATGKMAFTNYLMQSILCGLIFNGYGLGLFGQLERYQLYFVVLIVWGINISFSTFWLKRFYYGPFEWVWRMLTYWRRIPIKREPLPVGAEI